MTSKLYTLTKHDLRAAGRVMGDAFQADPLWLKLMATETDIAQKRALCLEMPIRFCHTYGHVLATSPQLEGIAATVPGQFAEMTFWRIIRSGGLPLMLKTGAALGKKMDDVFAPLGKDRQTHLQERDYTYLFLLGVQTSEQGKGYGKRLLETLIADSEEIGQPLYLETETPENVAMYEHFGFQVLKTTTLPLINQTMWEMLREPGQ